MGITPCVGCKHTLVMDTTFGCYHLQPRISPITELSYPFLEFQDTCKGGCLCGIKTHQDALINLRGASISELFRLPPSPGHEGPADVMTAGGIELLQLGERCILDIPLGLVRTFGNHLTTIHIGEDASHPISQLIHLCSES